MMINENLSFNYDNSFYKDVNSVNTIMKEYLESRKEMYKELFCSDEKYTEQDIESYLNFFCKYSTDMTNDTYPNLYHLFHFLERDYEIYIQDNICDLKNKIYKLLLNDDVNMDDFENSDFENIQAIESNWNDFLNAVSDIPTIDLNKMNYVDNFGVQCYIDPKTQEFVIDTFNRFIKNLHDDYPNVLLKLDTVVILPKDYIQFLASDDKTQAFFTNNTLFLASECDDCNSEEEKVFYETVLYHEFGHFIFSLMSESSQIMWHQLYMSWREKGTKMTRDDDVNSQLYDENGDESNEFIEELMADSFAMRYVGDKVKPDYYIHKPSSLITDSLDFILRNEFK